MRDVSKETSSRGLSQPGRRDLFDIEDFFDTRNWLRPFQKSMPAVNVCEDKKSYEIDVVAPGFKKEDFKINLEDNVLTISAETKQEDRDNGKEFSRREYSYNSFTRSFTLPNDVKDDKIDASYQDGILKLNIPKTETRERQAKAIPIH
jgi:HSP20 family protein